MLSRSDHFSYYYLATCRQKHAHTTYKQNSEKHGGDDEMSYETKISLVHRRNFSPEKCIR